MTGNRTLDNILFASSLGISILATSLFAYTQMIYKRELPQDQEEKKELLEEGKKVSFSEAFKMEKLVINLTSKNRRLRYLDTEIYLVPFKNDKHQVLEEHTAQINDMVIETVGTMEPEELNTISGKIILESRLKNGINKILREPVVKEIYFAKFVVQ